jgi:hypothetical protein
VIADPSVIHGCRGDGVRISQRYRGWYLRVADYVVGRDTAFAQRAYEHAEDVRPLHASPTTAVATTGRIRHGHGPHRPC